MRLTAEIQFLDPSLVSAVLPPPGDSDSERAAELKFFAHWAGQVLADFGVAPHTDILVYQLERHSFPGKDVEGRLDANTPLTENRFLPSLKWTDHHDGKPRRRFDAVLKGSEMRDLAYFELESQGDWRLKLHGMHFSRKQGMLDFGSSIFVLLHALLRRRRGEQTDYVERLLRNSRLIAFTYTIGALRLPAAWTSSATLAGLYGWTGQAPRFASVSLSAFRPKSVTDEWWLRNQLDAGRSSFAEVPDSDLPFVDHRGEEWDSLDSLETT